MNSRGQVQGFNLLKVAALAFVVVTVLLAIGSDVLDKTADNIAQDVCAATGHGWDETLKVCTNTTGGYPIGASNYTSTFNNTAAYNTTGQGLEGIGSLAGNLTTIATVVGAVILLGFLGVKLFRN